MAEKNQTKKPPMRLEETIPDLCAQFDIAPNELNLDLGPTGKLI